MNLNMTNRGLDTNREIDTNRSTDFNEFTETSPRYQTMIKESVSINEMHRSLNRERIRSLRISSLTDIVICICAIGIFGFVAYFVLEQKYIVV
jgi:hypothetical protein